MKHLCFRNDSRLKPSFQFAVVVFLIWMLTASTTVVASTESVVYSFNRFPRGFGPMNTLVPDAAGNFYGSTSAGGAFNKGTIFQVRSAANGRLSEKVIFSFNGS